LKKEQNTIVIIPCWWDGKLARYNIKNQEFIKLISVSNTVFNNSLLSTIKFLQPNTLNNEVETYPIPLNPPANFFDCMYKMVTKNKAPIINEKAKEKHNEIILLVTNL
jgi:hypothetical protein